MAKITKFKKSALRFGAHFAVMSAFDEKVVVVVNGEPMLTTAYNTFKAALNDEDAAVKIARASESRPWNRWGWGQPRGGRRELILNEE